MAMFSMCVQMFVMADVYDTGECHQSLCLPCRCWSWLTYTILVNVTCGYVHNLYAGAEILVNITCGYVCHVCAGVSHSPQDSDRLFFRGRHSGCPASDAMPWFAQASSLI